MFYWLYLTFASAGYVPILNLLKYQTTRTGLAIVTAQLVVVLLGSRFIRWMKAKQGKGQPIRAEGIERHIVEKAGTPTMGGVMILAGLFAGTLLWADLSNVYVWAVLLVTAGYGLLGFLDDYSKVTKQTTAGISGRVRLVLEAAIAMAAIVLIILFAAKPPESPELLTSVTFPLFKQLFIDMGWFYLLFGAFVIVGAANAVNFTDGLDGLATVPVMIAAAAYGLITYLVGNYVFANYLQLHFVPGVGELAVLCGALIGAGLGFLWYNAPPAKIFMGDTGSLALGGAVGAIAVAARHEIVLAIIGGLFVAELLSVVVQVASFKLTGKRVFRMAPVHHHFEKLGWSESTVVIRFWIVAVMLALVGLATLKLR
ncbi:MAG: phospho-N-acetylmuramoyl-pentapeptide-transferase [Phenylobacterium sp. RIFCSPHIGHO2_01_FULL_69_31]|jgi:phospho-N-acetylmuramoyl-pentapeptide-transferase|uniref:phospho-N-acetylmuramoyl-pentapeptide- transferase n=1 Tax=Phenylobacterium sp. RIFCSPHIGHO2_01_FULL_69_31 TaxID=1801944 RepID=UPI0008BE4996|nr:phospho-N-acetylmuramoyl-pentapeptide-transferase [Phenylobacterium sp. RIFCSPHIGHO2_01_FULL_69_31]OHB31803.1 MAG: phospho-N-acetylmuramoyl-pentapeptide-transferase [Phenylobacterium sp. RIFCSPHIGHO2_01_FULL_69_31]